MDNQENLEIRGNCKKLKLIARLHLETRLAALDSMGMTPKEVEEDMRERYKNEDKLR